MVYILLADGFEEIEALTTVDILRRSKIAVTTVGINSKIQIGAHQIPVICDIEIKEIDETNISMLILPGGEGHIHLDESKEVNELLNYCIKNNIYISAICAAPSILGKREFLKGKKATCFPGFEKYMIGADMTCEKTVHDDNFITGKGPGATSEFAFEIVKLLKNEETSEKVKEMMQY